MSVDSISAGVAKAIAVKRCHILAEICGAVDGISAFSEFWSLILLLLL